ncbi:DUF3253 domain-containing protein [Streptomyces erythrochromogenes]|uniref:DUF3253 domain-containing protein n=1 Tax=Streptomyces erythrochromogenes TaxID=285574 RepID=UPI00382C2928
MTSAGRKETTTGRHLEQAILKLLERRGPTATICPCDATRAVYAGDGDGWRDLMEPARRDGRRRHHRGEGAARARPAGRDGRRTVHRAGPLPLRAQARPGTHAGRRPLGRAAADPRRRPPSAHERGRRLRPGGHLLAGGPQARRQP